MPINQVKALITGKNIVLKPNPVTFGTPESVVDVGRAETLNMIGRNGELSPLFARMSGVSFQPSAISRTLTSFIHATGMNPPIVSQMTAAGGLFYFGSQDRMVRAYKPRRFGTEEEWNFEAELPIFYPPATSGDNLIASSGVLDYAFDDSQRRQFRELAKTGSMLGGAIGGDIGNVLALGGLLGGLFAPKPRTDLETTGHIYCLGRTDGRLKAELETAFPSTPVIKGNTAYVGGLGVLTALDVNSGDIVWHQGGKIVKGKVELEKPRDSRIWYTIALGSDNVLYALKTPVKMHGKGAPDSPFYLTVGGEQDGNVILAALDSTTGKEVWNLKLLHMNDYARPLSTNIQIEETTLGRRMVYCAVGEFVFAVDAGGKTVLWPKPEAARKRFENRNKEQKDPKEEALRQRQISRGWALGEGRIYLGTQDRQLLVIDANTGEEVGREAAGAVGTPLLHQGVVYFGTSELTKQNVVKGSVYAVDARDVKLIWRYRSENGIVDRPVVIDDVLYVGSSTNTAQVVAIPLPKR